MDALKADTLGVRHEDVQVATFAGKYGGRWVAFVPCEQRGRRVLCEGDVFDMCRWKADLKRIQTKEDS